METEAHPAALPWRVINSITSWARGRDQDVMRRGAFRQQFGAPNLTVHRADLLDVLCGALKTVNLGFGARCVAVEQCDRGAVARLADGSEIEADIVVGADGIHSVVRKSLFGPDAPRFTGCICWRGMAAARALPRDIAVAEGAMWMGPHGHVVHYPVRRGELINIVAHFDSDSWTEESWTRECDVSELTTTYAGWHPDLLRLYTYKRALVQMGALRSRSGRTMEQRAGNAAWRFRARYAALSWPGRGHGDRGRLRALSRDRAPRKRSR